jgi:hypothetical protein
LLGEKEVNKKMEQNKEELEEKVLEERIRNEAEIEPDRWYGICYGRDLDKDQGKNYQ